MEMAEVGQSEFAALSDSNLLGSLSSLLGYSVTELSASVVHELVELCAKKTKHCQGLEGRIGTLQSQLVSAEQVTNSLEQSLSQKDSQYSDYEVLKSSHAQLSEEYKKAANLNDILRNEFEGLQFQVKSVESKAEQLNSQKLTLIEALEEKQKQIEQFNLLLHDAHQGSLANRDDQLCKDQSIIQKNKEITQLNLNLNSFKSQLEQAKTSEQWSLQEIERLNSELVSLKKESLKEASSLRSAHSKLQSAYDDLGARHSRLSEEEGVRSRKIIELQDAIGKLQVQLKEQEAAFGEELTANARQAELYKSNCEELGQKLEELSGRSDENVMSQESVNHSLSNELQSLSQENNTLRERIQELDKFVQTFSVSPTAASLGSNHSAAEYQHLQNELTSLKIENERLRASLQEICRDVDDQVQVLQKEKRDNERLRLELASLSQQILSVCQQNERLSEDIRDTKAVNKQLEIQNASLFSQLSEFKSVLSGLDSKSAFDRSSAALESLQRRNEELCRKLAELEEEASPANIQRQLSEALGQISKLKEQRDRQNSLLEALSRKEHSAVNISNGISKEEHQRTISQYESHIAELQSRNNQLSVTIAKLEANCQLTQEKLHLLQNSFESQRSDLERTRAQLDAVNCSAQEAHRQLQSTSIDLIKSRDAERMEAVKSQKALIEASVAKEAEGRLQNALAETNAEKERLLNVMTRMQAALMENEQSFERYRESTTRNIEALQAKIQEPNSRFEGIQVELITLNAENQQLKQRLQEQARSIDTLLEARLKMATEGDLQTLKDTLEQYQAMHKSSEDAYNQLLNSFNNLKEAKDDEIQQLHASVSQADAQRQEFNRALHELASEKDALQAKLQVIETEGNHSILSSLEAALNDTRSQLDREIEEHRTVIEQLAAINNSYTELQSKFGDLDNEYKNLKAQINLNEERYQAEYQQWQENKQALDNRIQELSQQNSGFFTQMEELLKSKSSPILDGGFDEMCDDRFGQVISILKQQKDSLQMDNEKNLQDLRMTKLRLEQTQRTLDELRATMEHSKQNDYEKLEQDYQNLKEKFEQLLALRNSNQTLRNENTRLLSQVTNLEQEVTSVRESMEPINTQLRELRAELAGRARLIEQLQKQPSVQDDSQKVSELEAAKSQLEQRVSDLDTRYKRLITAVNNLRSENATLKESLEQLKPSEQERESLIHEYEMKNALLSQRCELLKAQLEKTKAVPKPSTLIAEEAVPKPSTPLTEEDEDEEYEEEADSDHHMSPELNMSSTFEEEETHDEVEDEVFSDDPLEDVQSAPVSPQKSPQEEETPIIFELPKQEAHLKSDEPQAEKEKIVDEMEFRAKPVEARKRGGI